jgi:uncharacterized protein (TIGR02270 family)
MTAVMIVSAVINQHTDDAISLASRRAAFVESPTARLRQLRRFDQRLAANLEGLKIAGKSMWKFVGPALQAPTAGTVFTLAARTIDDCDEYKLAQVVALAQAERDTLSGLLLAFCWSGRARLQGIVVALLNDGNGFKRMMGIAACAMHGIDPGIATSGYIHDADPLVRARTLRAAGELGLRQLVSTVTAAIDDEDAECQFWAAWSAVLLGDRNRALEMLARRAMAPGVERQRSFRLAFQAMPLSPAHAALKEMAGDPQQQRWLIQGSGIAGDPLYVPWLINLMSDAGRARLAGEAFTLITGVDLAVQALDRPAPGQLELGPGNDPEDPDIQMNPDDGLPWPDPERVQSWWAANAAGFVTGARYFVGAPVTREHCLSVLKNGTQRQRILAAHHLCLLEPGTPLFNTSAPAWRQQQLLEQMQ